MSALGSLVVKLALDHAEYTLGLDRSSQDALKFAQNSQKSFDQAGNSAKEFLSNVAGNVTGAIASVVGLNAAFSGIRESINVLDSLDEAAQKTGSSIEDLSRIAKVAKNFNDAFEPIDQAIVKLSKNLADIDNPSSDAIRALDAIGVSARDNEGKLRSSAAVYIDVARALQDYEDGSGKAAIANALFGKSGAELLPAINNLAQGIDDVTATSEEYTQQAALFNDQVAKGKARVNSLYMSMATELLPTLNTIAAAVNSSSSQFNVLSFASDAAKVVLKGLAIASYATVEAFTELGRGIGARAAQLAALARMDFSGAKFIGQAYVEDTAKSRAEFSKFVDTVWNGEQKIAAAVENGGTKKALEFQLNLPPAIDNTTRSLEKQAKVFDMELYKLKQYEADYKRARDITASVATKQEQYNQKLEELDRLKPYLSVESYNRALQKAQDELGEVQKAGENTFNELDQYAVQASRNIQTSLANFLFDPFNDGLKGMVQGVANAVRRMVAEFAAMKIANAIGLSSIFGLGSGASNAASSSGAGGIGFGNILGTGSNLMTAFNSGIGSLIGRGASALGFSSFGAGASGAASAGVFGAGGMNFLGGAGTALGAGAEFGTSAALGAGLASAAGPLAIAAAVDMGLRALFGNKSIGGTAGKVLGYVPIIGTLINGLFGRGPLKQKETQLTGDVGAEGLLSGYLTTNFKAKGGLLAGDKHDFAGVNLLTGAAETDNSKALSGVADSMISYAQQLAQQINESVGAVNTSLRGLSDTLGISTQPLDDFRHQINLVSESGKALTDEQIANEIAAISDEMVRKLMPTIDDFAKSGETSIQTLSRLANQFDVLTNSAGLLFGKSAAESKAFVNQFGFNDQTAFLDKFGGTDAFAQLVAGYSQNFLTEDQRMKPVIESLVSQRDNLGLSGINTRDQYIAAVDSGFSGKLSVDQFAFLLQNQDSINQVFTYLEKIGQAAPVAATGLSAVSRELNIADADRTEYGQRLNKSIQETTSAIAELESIATRLNDTVNAINPLSVDQARRIVSSGNLNDPNLQAALSVLGSMDSSAFSSGLEFQRAKGSNAAAVQSLQNMLSGQIAQKNSELAGFINEKELLQQGLAHAASAYSASIPRFASGTSYVRNTGLAVVHQGERIINPQQNQDLISSLKQLIVKVEQGTESSDNLRTLLRNAMEETDNGLALRQVTAA